jgi:hypothetical protein
MAYVDLNPIRAKMDTSIQQRIHALIKGEQPHKLMRFVSNHRQIMPKGIAYSLIDYCELVDCTGRCIQESRRHRASSYTRDGNGQSITSTHLNNSALHTFIATCTTCAQ